MSEPFQHITAETDRGVLVITVSETMLRDYNLAMSLENEMKRAVGESQTKSVVLDLKNVALMTSAALLSLLGLRSCVKEKSGELVLCNIQQTVAQALTASQLLVEKRNVEAHLKLAEDRQSALAMFQPQG